VKPPKVDFDALASVPGFEEAVAEDPGIGRLTAALNYAANSDLDMALVFGDDREAMTRFVQTFAATLVETAQDSGYHQHQAMSVAVAEAMVVGYAAAVLDFQEVAE
jgi:cobalamin biosynthesis protein CbiD